MNYLSKSDFIIASDCDRKMYYKKNGYTNHTYEDEFMSLLAEGGLLVAYVAKMLFEGGQEVDYKSNEANITMTTKLLGDNDNITLFDASVRHKKLLSKLDILVKHKNELTLFDVHSSSMDGPNDVFLNNNGTLKADKKRLLEDTAFQVYILKNKYPDMKITPMLMCLDKTKKSRYPNLLNNFRFEKTQVNEDGEIKPIIEFTGLKKQIVLDNDLFVKIDVTEYVDMMLPEVELKIDNLSQFITAKEIKYPKVPLSKTCKDCQFKEGKAECWKDMPKHDNDIFELYYNTTQKIDGDNVLDDLINEKKTSLFDWPLEEIKNGKITERQKIQIDNTKDNKEWFDKEKMLNEISHFKYPLHFIDFETTRPAIPHNKDDRPYEQLAFQWSCHTLQAPGAELIHKEWISFEKGFPNFKFAESLMKHLKTSGTVFMWHTHERTVLKDVLSQMEDRKYENPKLTDWLENITMPEATGRLKDMNRMAKDYYFHPEMKGKTSIKKVLPAIWNNSNFIKEDYNFRQFFDADDLKYDDPYKILENNPYLKCKQLDKINVGTDAIVAYQQMMRDLYMGDHDNAKDIKKMLIEYCKLDTFAMYIIWIHWINNLITDKTELTNDIIKIIKDTDTKSLTSKRVIVREKDIFKGFMLGGFRGLKNAELREVKLFESIDNPDYILFEIYHTNSSNSRISRGIKLEHIPTELLYKVHSILSSDKCDSLNHEYLELDEERKDLQVLALQKKSLTTKQSDRLRELNDMTQKIIDDFDKI